MNTDGLISVAVAAGCEVTEYEGHFAIRSHLDFHIVVTVPKGTVLIAEVLERVKSLLHL